MNHGTQFTIIADEVRFRVFYKPHFVERYELDLDRPAAKRSVSESDVRAKIEEAIRITPDGIADIAAGDPRAKGVISSKSLSLHMAFELYETNRGFQVTMTTMMVASEFHRRGLGEYVVKVNPWVTVKFSKGIRGSVRDAVIAEIPVVFPILEEGDAYHLGGETVEFFAQRHGDIVYIDNASWIEDLYEVNLP